MASSIPTGSIPQLGGSMTESDASAVLRHDTRARFWLGLFIIAQFVFLVAYIVYSGRELPDSQLILGAEIGFVTVVLQYFFGSSSGSVTKSAKGEPPSAEKLPAASP
jgi:hypothetical protein